MSTRTLTIVCGERTDDAIISAWAWILTETSAINGVGKVRVDNRALKHLRDLVRLVNQVKLNLF